MAKDLQESYKNFLHGGTLQTSSRNTSQVTVSSDYGYGHQGHSTGAAFGPQYVPPPPPPSSGPTAPTCQGYNYGYMPGTVQYPGVTVNSDYGYGTTVAPAGFNASYYQGYPYPAYQQGGIAAHQQSCGTPAYQTPTTSSQGPSASNLDNAKTPSTASSGNPWSKTKNAGVLGTKAKIPGGMMGARANPNRSGLGMMRPHPPQRSEQLMYCDICRISCAGAQAYKEHLAGQKHKKKELAAKVGMAATIPKGGTALHCEICDISCTGSDAYAAHIRGSKHQKVVKLHQKLGKPIPSTEPTLISNKGDRKSSGNVGSNETNGASSSAEPTATPTIGPVKPPSPAADAEVGVKQVTDCLTGEKVKIPLLPDELDLEPVGANYIEEIREGGKVVSFNCKLCDCKFTDPNAKEMHIKGRRHRLAYKKKVDPSIEVPEKSSVAKYKERFRDDRQKSHILPLMAPHANPRRGPLLGATPAEFMRNRMMDEGDRRYWDEGWGMFGNGGSRYGPGPGGYGPGAPPSLLNMPPVPAPPIFGMGPPSRMDPSYCAPSPEDRLVSSKHGELYPSQEEFSAVQTMLSHVEKALKMVSDVLTLPVVKSEADEGEKPKESVRALKGVMRVEALAKGLLLKDERVVGLVVLCTERPTATLLKAVVLHLPDQLLAASGKPDLYTLAEDFDEAAVTVSSIGEQKYTVKVTFTSFLVREENVGSDSAAKPDPSDLLPKRKCLEALAMLRHSKWYQVKANALQSCTMLIRIMRDFCRREKSWSVLKPWTLELLVYKVLATAGEPLSPGDALKRLFEAVSAGWLLPDGPGLVDPCEKNVTDAAGYLTDQEREDITATAQTCLRRIAFRLTREVLNMPQQAAVPDQAPRKRRLEGLEDVLEVAMEICEADKKTKVEEPAEVVVKTEEETREGDETPADEPAPTN